MEAFFVNSMWKDHKVNQAGKDKHYLIDKTRKFIVCDATQPGRQKPLPDTIYARYHTEVGKGNQIPLWLLGFLY